MLQETAGRTVRESVEGISPRPLLRSPHGGAYPFAVPDLSPESHPDMKKTLLLALTFAFVTGCASETEAPVEEPVVGEAEAVTEVEEGPVDDTLIVDEELDPTYVPEEESVDGDVMEEGDMTEGEVLESEGD